MVVTTERKTKDARREEILDAALLEFAERGLHGASTEDIARRAGISQPYVFRLFGTKKELFRAVVARCFRETLEMFQRAAEGHARRRGARGDGRRPTSSSSQTDSVRLRAQMQAYAACDDPEIREAVRQGFGDLVAYAERVSGCRRSRSAQFFATGMLLNVFASMGQFGDGRRAVGAAPARRLRKRQPNLSFFSSEVSDESQNTDNHKLIWAFVLTSAAGFMVTLDNLVVTTALPVIRHDLGAGLSTGSSGRSTPTRSPSRCCC